MSILLTRPVGKVDERWANDLITQLMNAIDELQRQIDANKLPAGVILLYSSNFGTIPEGFLPTDGASYSVDTYPVLARYLGDVSGTFIIPNLIWTVGPVFPYEEDLFSTTVIIKT